jgi:hypothetical protein
MKRLLFLMSVLLLASRPDAWAQITTCAQTLRLANSTYEQGRLHELPELLKNCIHSDVKEERVTAYKLLTLAYIYLEEPEKADQSMLELLRTDHDFAPNPDVDPAEFIGLYKTFRTKPVFQVGFKLGTNTVLPSVTDNYYVGDASAGKGKYAQKVGFQFGLVFEKEIFAGSTNKYLKRITLAPEVLYVTRGFKYSNASVFADDQTNASSANLVGIYKQNWIDVNVIAQYKLGDGNLHPYIGVGPGVSKLMSASNQLTLTRVSGNVVSGPDVIVTTSYNPIMISALALAGIKYKFGSVFLIAEARFQYGLSNVINPSKRTNAESVFDYSSQFNNFKQSTAGVNIGVVYPYFNPKKLRRK